PISMLPAISIPGALQSGGSVSGNLNQRIVSAEAASTAILSVGRQTLKAGLEIFRFATEEVRRNNFAGTFTFGGQCRPAAGCLSGIDQFRTVLAGVPGATPTSYTRNTGNPNLSAIQWQADIFIQDDWKIDPRLSLSLGFRYEMQTFPMDRGNV